ncbi:hypothetical protein L3X38_012963 [Prunus dulcis]|uniref:Uncharacterized protein n=1 Tax=Prunus dulcis TaxID=3755 RepID=A0AAD4WL25_PRUDU|nr:hypothetical protein L3X38_012963 [Prunus dulcis]
MGAGDEAVSENTKEGCEPEEVDGAHEKLEAVAGGVTVMGVEVVGFERREPGWKEKRGNEGVVEAEDDEEELNKGVEETVEDELNRDEAEAEPEPIRGERDADTVEAEEQNQDDGAEVAAEDLNPKEWAAAELGLEDQKAGAEVDVAGEMTGGLVNGKGVNREEAEEEDPNGKPDIVFPLLSSPCSLLPLLFSLSVQALVNVNCLGFQQEFMGWAVQ